MDRSKTFELWMARVTKFLERMSGLHPDDLPDMPYRDWFEDDVSPERAATRALRAALMMDRKKWRREEFCADVDRECCDCEWCRFGRMDSQALRLRDGYHVAGVGFRGAA